MSISVHVRSSEHNDISSYGDNRDEIPQIRDAAADGTLLRCISKHSDTMFNGKQIRQLIDEIDRFPRSSSNFDQPLRMLRAAAQSALGANGYLWFSGD